MIERKETKWLNIALLDHTDKTAKYTVRNKENNVLLGIIKWFGSWRKYAFFPCSDMVFETQCLSDITGFLNELMEDRKNSKTKTI